MAPHPLVNGIPNTEKFVSTAANRAADRARLHAIDEETDNVLRRLEALRSERVEVTQRLAVYRYPFLTLANEIILEIMKQYLPPYPECPPLLGDGSPTILTQVCRRWREVAHSTGDLWRAIQLPECPPGMSAGPQLLEIVMEWLEHKSRSLPLSICLPEELGAYIDPQDGSNRYHQVAKLCHALLGHSSRWQHVKWRQPYLYQMGSALPDLVGEMPMLEGLHLDCCDYRKIGHLGASAPRLLSFTVIFHLHHEDSDISSLHPQIVNYRHLTRLRLDPISPPSAAQILQQTKQLRECWLFLIFDYIFSVDDKTVCSMELPHLTTMILDSGSAHSCHDFFAALRVPALKKLALKEDMVTPDPLARLASTLAGLGCQLEGLGIRHAVIGSEEEYREAFPSIKQLEFNANYGTWKPSIEAWGGPWA